MKPYHSKVNKGQWKQKSTYLKPKAKLLWWKLVRNCFQKLQLSSFWCVVVIWVFFVSPFAITSWSWRNTWGDFKCFFVSQNRARCCHCKKMKFSIKDFFSKFDRIRMKLRIWWHLVKKFLNENFIFCAVWSSWDD